VSQLLNNTRLIPEIFNHTSQLTALWAQLMNMSNKLNAIEDRLDNCSFIAANGLVTLPPPTTTPVPTQSTTPTPGK